jgi:hypothetical protein
MKHKPPNIRRSLNAAPAFESARRVRAANFSPAPVLEDTGSPRRFARGRPFVARPTGRG